MQFSPQGDEDLCSFPGCTNTIWVKKDRLCNTHYTQKNRGRDLTPIKHRIPITDLDSLLTRGVRVGSCIVIPVDSEDSRARLSFRGKTWLAHRISYYLRYGDIPDGAVIHHICANGSCINPDHLQLADQADNILEMLARKTFEARIASLEMEVERLKQEIADLKGRVA